MAPNVTAHFFASNAVNAPPIHEITDEDSFFRGLKLNPERDGLGSAELLLSRSINFAGFASGTFLPEVFVRFLVHAYSDTDYYPWGMSLSKRQQTVVHKDEKGAEAFRFGGPGPKSLLSRHGLGIASSMAGDWNLDLANGVWRWTANASIGQILNRVLNEDQLRTAPSLPFLTTTFTSSKDSAGVDWADLDVGADGLYEIPIGTDYLTILRDLDDLVELSAWIDLGTVSDPKFELNVIQGTRHDYTGSAVGSSVCLLKEGLNIANDSLEVDGASLKKATHVIVEGKDGHWVVAIRPSWSIGDYVKWAKIEYTRSSSDYWLEKAGIRWLQRQDLGEREITVEIVPGADDAAGEYFPAPDRVLWLDNLVSVDTSADGTTHSQLDIAPSEDQLVTALELELGNAGSTDSAEAMARSWNVKAILNRERPPVVPQRPNQGSASNPPGGGGGGGGGVQLCDPAIPGDPGSDEATTLLKFFDANDGGDAIGWTGILANQGGSPGSGAEGSSYYYFKSTAPEQWQNVFAAAAGTTYRVTGYVKGPWDPGETLKIGFFSSSPGSGPGNNISLVGAYTALAVGPFSSGLHSFAYDIVAPPGTNSMALGRHGGGVGFDRIRIYSVDAPEVPPTEGDPGDCPEDVALECAPGTGDSAARCDHVHAHGELGTDALHDVSQISGLSASAFPSLLTSFKGSADTPDDDFPGTALDAKWTAADGSASTITLLKSSGAGIYQVGLIDSWLHMLVGVSSGDSVELRQDYTLPDGKCIVAPILVGPDNAGSSGGISNNEFNVGIGVNSTDTPDHAAGTYFTVMIDSQASAAMRLISWDGSTVFGTMPDSPAIGRAWFLRIDRVGLVYHAFAAPLTMGYPAWEYLGSKTLGSAATNVWLYAQAAATSANRILVAVPWFRQGTALAVNPF